MANGTTPVTPGSGPSLAAVAPLQSATATSPWAQKAAVLTSPYRPLSPIRTFTVSSTVVTLGDGTAGAIPAGATHALLSVEATSAATDTDGLIDGIRITEEGTAPTSSLGLFLAGGTSIELSPWTVDGSSNWVSVLNQVKLIRAQATDMKVSISYRAYV